MRSVKGGANYLVLGPRRRARWAGCPTPGSCGFRPTATSPVASRASHPALLRDLLEGAALPRSRLEPDLRGVGRGRPRVGGARRLTAAPAEGQPRRDHGVQRGALTALNWFALETGFVDGAYRPSIGYNDVLRWMYDALFALNVEVDFVHAESDDLDRYALILTPALYSAPEQTVRRLRNSSPAATPPLHLPDSRGRRELRGLARRRATRSHGRRFGATYLPVLHPDGARVAFADRPSRRRTPRRCSNCSGPPERRCSRRTRTRVERVRSGHPQRVRRGGGHLSPPTKVAPGRWGRSWPTPCVAGLWEWPQELAGSLTVRRGTNGRGRPVTYFLNYSGAVTVEVPVTGDVVVSLDRGWAADGRPVGPRRRRADG